MGKILSKRSRGRARRREKERRQTSAEKGINADGRGAGQKRGRRGEDREDSGGTQLRVRDMNPGRQKREQREKEAGIEAEEGGVEDETKKRRCALVGEKHFAKTQKS